MLVMLCFGSAFGFRHTNIEDDTMISPLSPLLASSYWQAGHFYRLLAAFGVVGWCFWLFCVLRLVLFSRFFLM